MKMDSKQIWNFVGRVATIAGGVIAGMWIQRTFIEAPREEGDE